MRIIVETEKLAEFIFEHLTGDCECRTLCNKYCENHSTCIESIELCLIDEFEKGKRGRIMGAEDIEYMGDYKEFPTKESALDWLDNYLILDERNNLIRALQQEPILDKIRAEIEQIYQEIDTVSHDEYENAVEQGKERAYENVLAIIDNYKRKKNE